MAMNTYIPDNLLNLQGKEQKKFWYKYLMKG